ncbi:MAG TPA: hypothetical protein VFH39_00930 [Candidatus Saccharimonadales bacterium]|nr:hypothetical protein [Candidatus Saccharimonadales bacterium]
MRETLRRVWMAAGLSGAASLAISGCTGASHETPSPDSLTPQQAYREAHCRNMTARPAAQAGEFILTITGHARVPADYGVVVIRNSGSADPLTTAKIFKLSNSGHDETVTGIVDLTSTTPGLSRFDITGIVSPDGYHGQLMTDRTCQYTAYFEPNPSSVTQPEQPA